MYSFGKKLSSVIIIVIMFIAYIYFKKVNEEEINQKTKQTVAIPSSGKVIVLDAGHGKPDERSCLLTLKITLIFYKK